MTIDIDPKTGAPVVVPETPVSTLTDANPSSDFAVQDVASTLQPITETDSETISSETGTDKSKSDESETEEQRVLRETIAKVLKDEAENQVMKSETPAPETQQRKREGQYRAIDRILRFGGMDSQQADKAMTEIRRILSE